MSALIRLLCDLDRLGPGNAESLRWALGVAGVQPDARLLDTGCGTGADLGTLLAAVPQGAVVALDRQAEFIDRVRQRFVRVTAHVGDLRSPPDGPYDLIWSAGAVCFVGVETALNAWRDHLAPGGRVAFSDTRWRGEARSNAVTRFFAAEGCGPPGDVADLEAEVERAGYRIRDARWLGAPGWASYYGPLETALDTAETDLNAIAALRAEIVQWRTHGVTYGCRLVVCEPA